MPVNLKTLRANVQTFEWVSVFRDSLKWGRPTDNVRTEMVDGIHYTLTPIADTGGMHIYQVSSATGELPAQHIRRMIENRLRRQQVEHILIFEDAERQTAVLQWIKRGLSGSHNREFRYQRGDPGDLVIQKLSGIAFEITDFDAQGRIEITKVKDRVAKNLDVESVTKRFYEEFTRQRKTFQEFLSGIPIERDQRWYVSVMLNRLMFISFIQAKEFLNNNPDYLRERLAWSKANLGPNQYYRGFLRVLFFDGFALEEQQRSAEAKRRIGTVPYLNGGLFLPHPIEDQYGSAIDIPDAAFEKLLNFFSEWRWHLSERPGESQKEIDPDVLGYIFEKYINQKQMGAYYTRDDITGYICRNTIIPALFDKANLSLNALNVPTTIRNFIYLAMLQEERLPTETEREQHARRERVAHLVSDAQSGRIATINDAITANLDVEALIATLIPQLDAPKLYQLYTALAGDPASGKLPLSVLDPTCGSGAFLFAALRLLKSIYEAVLDRMDELSEQGKTERMPIREVREAAEQHSNRDYFITKSIIVRNLYGVDLMAEATEICKLRLFLRMVADLDSPKQIEPLPDIDFNIRAGNALVGYARPEEIGLAYSGGLGTMMNARQQKLLEEIKGVQRELRSYRDAQLQFNPSATEGRSASQQIRARLDVINTGLDNDLIKIGQLRKEVDGSTNTQPFHWFTAFYEILDSGGFDVIVGNPPYVEYSKVKGDYKINGEDRYKIYGYKTEGCGNLYAYMMEKVLQLQSVGGYVGMIIPVASVCTDGYLSLQKLLRQTGNLTISNYNDRPGKLFDGLEHIRLSIILHRQVSDPQKRVFTTRYNRWQTAERPELFEKLTYGDASAFVVDGSIPKVHHPLEPAILKRLASQTQTLSLYEVPEGKSPIYYTRKLSSFVQILDFVPTIYDATGKLREPSELKEIRFPTDATRDIFLAILNSNLFYWMLTLYSDCRNLNKREIYAVRFDVEKVQPSVLKSLSTLTQRLMKDFQANSSVVDMNYKTMGKLSIQCIYPKLSKPIIDEIDRVLAQHYGFTDAELDFIINYDIKYRMGREVEEAGGGEE